jgi:hypothetical protein
MMAMSLSVVGGSLETGLDRRIGHSERIEKSTILIFLSYIFLFRFREQKNVGEENKNS